MYINFTIHNKKSHQTSLQLQSMEHLQQQQGRSQRCLVRACHAARADHAPMHLLTQLQSQAPYTALGVVCGGTLHAGEECIAQFNWQLHCDLHL